MTRNYIDTREALAGDLRRNSVPLEEGAIGAYLASRSGAGMDPSSAREFAAVFMSDVSAAIAQRSGVTTRAAMQRDVSNVCRQLEERSASWIRQLKVRRSV